MNYLGPMNNWMCIKEENLINLCTLCLYSKRMIMVVSYRSTILLTSHHDSDVSCTCDSSISIYGNGATNLSLIHAFPNSFIKINEI